MLVGPGSTFWGRRGLLPGRRAWLAVASFRMRSASKPATLFMGHMAHEGGAPQGPVEGFLVRSLSCLTAPQLCFSPVPLVGVSRVQILCTPNSTSLFPGEPHLMG